jgi:ankyrin repeat protein
MKRRIYFPVFHQAVAIMLAIWCGVQKSSAQSFNNYTNRPALHISGTVSDASGFPAGDVRVSFHPGQYPQAPYYAETNTDKNGQYDLTIQQDTNLYWGWDGFVSLTNFVLAQDLRRNLVATEDFATIPKKLDLRLQSGIIISGSVKNTDDAPVTNAEINLRITVGNTLPLVEPMTPVKADERGSFQFLPLPRGRDYAIFGVTAKGYGSAYARVEAKDTQTNHYTFPTLVLKKTGRVLAGQVLDTDGKPIADANVRFYGKDQPESPTTKSDDSGHFIFEACEGDVQLSANALIGPANHSSFINVNDVKAKAGDTNIVITLGLTDDTPLQRAAKTGDLELAKWALTNHANINLKDSEGRTPLCWAAENGYKEIVALLLTNKADVHVKDRFFGDTPLHRAALKGNLEIVKLLLAHGADVNALDDGVQTPLHWAIMYRHKSVVTLLRKEGGLENGYDVEYEAGTTNWEVDATHNWPAGNLDWQHATGTNHWDVDAIQEAIHRGDVSAIKKLLKGNPALISSKDKQSRTPLILAALHNRPDIVELFLTDKAYINATDNIGRTALHWAALAGSADVVKLLLKKNADADAKADGGMTPLHLAAQNGYQDVAELLVNYADVNATNNIGETPLRIVELELQSIPDPTRTVETRIYHARLQGRKDFADCLKLHGGHE